MPVFRVERNKGYTVTSNYHLRALALRAKGLLSQILNLPEDWDYTLSGPVLHQPGEQGRHPYRRQ